MGNAKEVFTELGRLILLTDPDQKCAAVQALFSAFSPASHLEHTAPILDFPQPGLPPTVELVAPRLLKRRGIQAQPGRNILLHAIAHIEFNAINLALDAAYRFRDQPFQYYYDWLSVAADEARHFNLIRDYLRANGSDYGHYPAHNGLWEMALVTADDVVARMALVPRVMEARGLDVTPAMISRLQRAGDAAAVAILEIIYQDEIGHVAIGSKWFRFQCAQRQLEPRATFQKLVAIHLHGELRGPFNLAARLAAGFDEEEMAQLTELAR